MEQSHCFWDLGYKRPFNSHTTDYFLGAVRDDAQSADRRERGSGRIC